MSDLDYSKLTDAQLLALKAAGGDLTKLPNDELASIHSTLNPSPTRQVLDAVKESAAAFADFGGRASDYRDTMFAKAMGGVAGLPRAAVDVANWAYPTETGRNIAAALPSAEGVSNAMLNRAKANPSFHERSINPIIDAAVQAPMAGALLGAGGRFGPLINAGAGAGSEALGELAQSDPKLAPYETPMRIGGALLGAGAGLVPAYGMRVAKGAVQPFTAAGRDTLVGTALNKAAAEPASAIPALETYEAGRAAYPGAAPGFRLNAGTASRDAGLMAAADTLPANVKGPIAQANNRTLNVALDRASAGLPLAENAGPIIQGQLGDTVGGLELTRARETAPLYKAVRESPTPVNPWGPLTFTADAIAANKEPITPVMQRARDLLFTAPNVPDRTAAGMLASRQAVQQMIGEQPAGTYTQRLLGDLKGKIDESLSSVPEAAAANTRYAELSRNLDPFNPDLGNLNATMGKIVERNQYNTGYMMPGEKVPSTLMKPGELSAPMMRQLTEASGGNPIIQRAMQSAYIDDFKKAAASKTAEGAAGEPLLQANGANAWLQKHGAGATTVLTPDQMAALREVADHLKSQSQPVPGSVGSQTFNRLGTNSVLSSVLTSPLAKLPLFDILKKGAGLAYGGADEAMMGRLYQALQDPATAAALMRKATPANLSSTKDVVGQILRPFPGGSAAAVNLPSERNAQ